MIDQGAHSDANGGRSGEPMRRAPSSASAGDSLWTGVDQTCFDSLLISGSAMFADHMPQSYVRVLFGDVYVVD